MKRIALLALLALSPLAHALDPLADLPLTVGLPTPMPVGHSNVDDLVPVARAPVQFYEPPDVTRSTLQIYDMGHGQLEYHNVYGPDQTGGAEYIDYSGYSDY